MYTNFWKQFLLEAANPTFNFNLDGPTAPDPPERKPTGIKAYLSGSNFYVDGYLGGGADGKVYRIADKTTGKRMALKVISPSTARGRNEGQDLVREVNNYKFLMNKKKTFGEKAKYFPIVYRTGVVDIPKPLETSDGLKERAGLIFMEELGPLPDDLVKKLFAISGKIKGSSLSQRDKILFNNKTIIKNFLKEVLSSTRGIGVRQDKFNKIIDDAVELYSNFSLSPKLSALLATEKESQKKISKYGKRLMASLIDSLIKNHMQRWEDEKTFSNSLAVGIFRPFIYNYSRPLKTTDSTASESPSDIGSVYVGFDDAFDKEDYIDSQFPEAETLKKQVRAFEELGINFFDVHSQNVMMRPKTNDIVIVDVGRFYI